MGGLGAGKLSEKGILVAGQRGEGILTQINNVVHRYLDVLQGLLSAHGRA
jgi:hypothetical protein